MILLSARARAGRRVPPRRPVLAGGLAVLGVAAALVLAGCGAPSVGPTGGGMMGDGTGGGNAGYMAAPLTCSAPASLPGPTVTVTLADMGMTQMMGGTAPMGAVMRLTASPATVAAGEITLVADNVGWRTHELVVLPLANGQVAGQRVVGADGKVDEAGSLGEASNSCAAGQGEGIPSGSVGWTTLTLAPGHYELVCNLTNHYADHMYQELVVT